MKRLLVILFLVWAPAWATDLKSLCADEQEGTALMVKKMNITGVEPHVFVNGDHGSKGAPMSGAYWIQGKRVRDVYGDGLIVLSAFDRYDGYFRFDFIIINCNPSLVEVNPDTTMLFEETPQKKTLAYQSSAKVGNRGRGTSILAMFLAGMGSSATRQSQVRITDAATGETVARGTITSPDLAAQERSERQMENIQENRRRKEEEAESMALKRNTLGQFSLARGDVFFKEDKHAKTLLLEVTVGDSKFIIPWNTESDLNSQ